MKLVLLFSLLLSASLARAEAIVATVTEDTKMEVTRGKGTILLKAGTVVEVVSKEGGSLGVLYRNIPGLLPVAKTSYKGETIPVAASSAKNDSSVAKTNAVTKASPPSKTAEGKEEPSLKRDAPSSMYGKMIEKARDSEAKHKDNLVDPVESESTAKKK